MIHILKLKEFKRKILNNEPIDFEPYLSHRVDIQYKIFMAERGILANELMETDIPEVIMTLIDNNHATEYYEKLVHHTNDSVKQALARNGHFLDELIQDENKGVKYQVVKYDKSYLSQVPCTSTYEYIYRMTFYEDINPDINAMKKYLDYKESLDVYPRDEYLEYEAIKLKYQSLTTEPTMLENTMTPYQLYQTGSNLWATGVTPRIIRYVIDMENTKQTKLTQEQFERELNYQYTNTRKIIIAQTRGGKGRHQFYPNAINTYITQPK